MRTRLRSKFTLFFIVCAALLAISGTAMALVTDTSGNTAPAPTIQSDKADYAPGELVTLTGSGWQADESVNIKVNDDEGQTWSRNVDVNADGSGNISDSFNLPDWFVATYTVTATGTQSGTVTTSFTDANPSDLVVNPTSATVTRGASAIYGLTVQMGGSSAPCTTTLSASGLPTGTTASFSGNPNPRTGNTNYTSTLTVTTTATGNESGRTPLGSDQFTVTMTRGSDCQGSGNISKDATLVVNPRAPSNLQATPNGSNSINLTWNASPDSAAITKYLVFEGTTEVASTANNTTTSASITGLQAQSTHTYTVKARYTDASSVNYDSVASNSATATTTAATQTLSVTKAGTGTGTVTSSPTGINCGSDCSETYNNGTSVTLTASPDASSTFAGWSGAGTTNTDGTRTVSMSQAQNVTATFTLNTYALTVTKDGTGTGTVTSSPAGINCGTDCSETYNHGTNVTLTASPDASSTFAGWSGGSGTTNADGTYTVSMSQARSVTATFTLKTYALDVTKDGTGTGTVTSSPAGINCGTGTGCSASFNHGTSVTLTAAPDASSTFASWSGAGTTNTDGTRTVSMSQAQNVTATFTLKTYALDVTKDGTGTGTVTSTPAGINCGTDCSETYNHGTSVTLTASADASSTFAGWSGAGTTNTDGTRTVSMTEARSVTATFTLKTYALDVTKDGAGGGTVTSSPSGIDCGSTCSASFNHGTSVTLTASPNATSTFNGWSGGNGTTNTDGTYTVSMTQADSVTATFKANQTITFGTLSDKTYGDAPFDLSATGGGSGNPVTFALGTNSKGCSLSGTNNKTVTITAANALGEKCIIVASQAGNANYNAATDVTRDFTIAKASLTVTANDQTKILGASDPSFTFTYGAFVNNENSSVIGTAPTCGVSGTHTDVGSYQIVCSGGDDDNYSFTYVNGTLKILYSFSGYLQPINDTAHQPVTGVLESKFKLGQTIPVKFNIYNSAGIAVQQATNPTFTKVSHGACDSQTALEAPTTETPTNSGQFVWTTDHYQYNWSTKGLSAGEYRIHANLADGTGQLNTDPLKQNYTDICLTK